MQKKPMLSRSLHMAVDILDQFYPDVETAFLTDASYHESGAFIQIMIISRYFNYHTVEAFTHNGTLAEILVFPDSHFAATQKHFDFAANHNLMFAIASGMLIKDNLNTGEMLQQTYQLIENVVAPFATGEVFNRKRFELTKLIILLEASDVPEKNFLLKSQIVGQLNELHSALKGQNEYGAMIQKLATSFNEKKLFLEIVNESLEQLGGPIAFYAEDQVRNSFTGDELNLMISTVLPIDSFISMFLIFLLEKVKTVAHKIQFAFKTYAPSKYLITIWSSNETLTNDIIPAVQLIYASNDSFYLNFRPAYPFFDKRKAINEMLVDRKKLKNLQVLVSSHLLDLKLNENNGLSEGFRLSYGIYITIEIFQLVNMSRENAQYVSGDLFSKWLSLAYETEQTNFSDLELQSHKIINDFENLYLEQQPTLQSNFYNMVSEWQQQEESIIGLQKLVEGITTISQNESVLTITLCGDSVTAKRQMTLEIILYEVYSILGIDDYHKSYIVYTTNRLLHEA